MLEDFTMEKKPLGRLVQAPGKGLCTDSKKNQDVAGAAKPYPRLYRRRDPAQSNGFKNDGKRTTSQKNKFIDKRSRSKGQLTSSGKEDSKVEVFPTEKHGTVLTGKKQSLNHLLNFHYAPRESGGHNHGSWRQSPVGRGRISINTYKHKYEKDQFLQANCQFVVRQACDYTEHLIDPDRLVAWDNIELINFRTTEDLSCPICLYPPNAAKMTRCGHIFCWSCILHYLALTFTRSRTCPICFDNVERSDLKSVVVVRCNLYSVGDEITLRLMRRERGCLLPVRVEKNMQNPCDKLLSISEKDHDTNYSKLLLATPREVQGILAQERSELEARLTSEIGCPEQSFTEQALDLLREREQLLCFKDTALIAAKSSVKRFLMMKSQLETCQSEKEERMIPTPPSVNQEILGEECESHCLTPRKRFESSGSEGFNSEDGISSVTVEDLEIPPLVHSASVASSGGAKNYYFYQAADGQHIYLHAVNIQMLGYEYGCLENCPLVIKGRIIEKESGSMTVELRNRLRYLQHLPITCQFEVVEIQLRQPYITAQTLHNFQDQLDRRRSRRQIRKKMEKKREKRINDEEKRRLGQYPTPYLHLQSHKQFPECGNQSELERTSSVSFTLNQEISAGLGALSLEEAGTTTTTTAAAAAVEDDAACGPSFAQMLREGKSRCLTHRRIKHQDTLEEEQEVSGPGKQQYLSEAISKAIEEATALKEDSVQDGGKKKKKQKRKVLFSTGMTYQNK